MIFLIKNLLKLALKFGIFTILISGCTLGLLGVLWGFDSRHKYSFSLISIKIIAFFYFTTCVTLVTATFLGLSLSSSKDSLIKNIILYNGCLLTSILILLFIGTYGLYSVSSGNINVAIKNKMFYNFEKYDEKQESLYETETLNWLHRKFNCCGINSYVSFKFERLKKHLVSYCCFS